MHGTMRRPFILGLARNRQPAPAYKSIPNFLAQSKNIRNAN
jgi:hypothetical protein